MIGVPGTAHRLFGALREEGDLGDPHLAGQLRALHLLRDSAGAGRARRRGRARAPSSASSRKGQIQSVDIDPDLAILAVVGDGMAGTPGIAAKVFAALGTSGVNVRAIAQGASERNISVVVDGRSATRALRAVHAGLYLSPHTLSIGVIGPGTVGRVLLDQLASQSERLRQQFKLDLRVRGLLGSQRMLLADPGIALGDWRAQYQASSRRRRSDALRRARARRLPAAHGARRLHGERGGRRPLRRLAGAPASTSSPPTRRPTAATSPYYQRLQSARRTGGVALPVRGDGRGGAAGGADAARPARDRGRDRRASRASSPARSRICSTSTTAARASRRSCARRASAASPSRIRATISPAWTWRASSSSSAARWAWRSS